ncbi:unnamed protein product [Ceutorhynchus assimilis]|uniref:Uncharacterized protein n=1 Tax=Ceutorhynchus assimilis TaxID=467358 RepID=A0A9N9MIK6_9CUCU|nr:unnamed protein product [Ceutorhynchus assimilis]
MLTQREYLKAIKPQKISMTWKMSNITDTLIQENVGKNSEEKIENRFSKSRKIVEPHSKTDAVLLEMEKANAGRDAQFQTFLQHLKKTED